MATLKECCRTAESDENLSVSDVVLRFVDHTSSARGVVELGRNVCKGEEAKLILGYPNKYPKCLHILHLVESINAGLTNTVSAIFHAASTRTILSL